MIQIDVAGNVSAETIKNFGFESQPLPTPVITQVSGLQFSTTPEDSVLSLADFTANPQITVSGTSTVTNLNSKDGADRIYVSSTADVNALTGSTGFVTGNVVSFSGDDRPVLQGRLTLIRYNNEPQFFLADAEVFYGLIADILERLGPHSDPASIDAETLTRLRDALALIERRTAARDRS